MRLDEWRLLTVKSDCTRHDSVVCVVLPFLDVPGVMEHIFPHSDINYVSIVPRNFAETPSVSSASTTNMDIPFLDLHTLLAEAYWSATKRSEAWSWLEQDFETIRNWGFDFRAGEIENYKQILRSIAPQVAKFIDNLIERTSSSAICVYGRGHWCMNVAAHAASIRQIPLYVVERGILPNSYIVDIEVPFPAPQSCFRKCWEEFKGLSEKQVWHTNGEQFSRWELYVSKTEEECHQEYSGSKNTTVLVGQCHFDFNCLNSEFNGPREFVEMCVEKMPESWKKNQYIYRPHPLSLEEYPSQFIRTQYGKIPVDRTPPQKLLAIGRPMCSWNSTLCLESLLFYGNEAVAFDPQCYYTSINFADGRERAIFISYLKEISTIYEGEKPE